MSPFNSERINLELSGIVVKVNVYCSLKRESAAILTTYILDKRSYNETNGHNHSSCYLVIFENRKPIS